MISPPNKVLIWQSQLTANDFPPVCAMTGAPAETWRKYTFSSAPPWAFWVGGLLLSSILARRASGYLPLTHASVKKIRLFTWGLLGLIPLAFVFWVVGAIVGSAGVADTVASTIVLFLFILGIAAILLALIGFLIVRNSLGPTGKLFEPQPGHYESLIELRNVHPAFVSAVQQLQYSRSQSAAQAQQSPFPGKWQ